MFGSVELDIEYGDTRDVASSVFDVGCRGKTVEGRGCSFRVNTIEAQKLLLSRHLHIVNAFDARATCMSTVGILQEAGTCWFNAMCNAIFFSDWGRVFVRCMYPDWVTGYLAPKDKARYNRLRLFRMMADLAWEPNTIETMVPVKTTRIINSLRRYCALDEKGKVSDKLFFPIMNTGKNSGGLEYLWLRRLLEFLGANSVLHLPRGHGKYAMFGGTYQYVLDAIEYEERYRRFRPLAIVIACGSDMNDRIPKSQTFFGATYVADSAVVAGNGHAMAGVTCHDQHYVVDSNGNWIERVGKWDRGKLPGQDRVKKVDWLDCQPFTTLTHKDFEYRDYSRTIIYWDVETLKNMWNSSKGVAKALRTNLDSENKVAVPRLFKWTKNPLYVKQRTPKTAQGGRR
jgi:hypothetical protein